MITYGYFNGVNSQVAFDIAVNHIPDTVTGAWWRCEV